MDISNSDSCGICNLCFVRSDSVFKVLTKDEVLEVEAVKDFLNFRKGELIFKEKSRPFGIYVIHDGKVKISKHGYEGREYIVRFAKRGSIIGYRSFFSRGQYSCSATAISETKLCFIPGDIIFSIIRRNPEFGLQFMQYMALDLKAAEEKAIRIAQKPASERVAESILILKDIYGYERDGNVVDVSLTRDEIASIAGTTRETVTRLLSEYNEEKILLVKGRKIRIIDINRLIQDSKKSF